MIYPVPMVDGEYETRSTEHCDRLTSQLQMGMTRSPSETPPAVHASEQDKTRLDGRYEYLNTCETIYLRAILLYYGS
jgi:hypothetical protein